MLYHCVLKSFLFFKFLTACEPNFFGKNCAFECHCPDNDTCSNINGLCSSGNCHEEYGGPGCQRRTSITLLKSYFMTLSKLFRRKD